VSVFGKLFPLGFLERQVRECSNHFILGVLLLQLVVHSFELFLKCLANERVQNSEDLLRVTNSDDRFAAQAVHIA